MAKKLFIITIAIFIICGTVESTLPCKFIDTIHLTDGYKDKNNNFIYKDDVFPHGTYEEFSYVEDLDGKRTSVEPHIRGCICNLKPCVRVCCIENEFSCQRPDIMNVTNEEYENVIIDLSDKYGLLNGRPCIQMFTLEPEKYEEDSWRLLRNGSIIRSAVVYNTDGYCIDVNFISKTTAFLCYQPQNDIRFSVYPIGMLISIPFLIITFLVYALVPELRNLHGKCLMCYTLALVLLYTALIIVQTGAFDIVLETFQCYAMGCLIYFAVLLTFFWMNVMCFDIWKTACYGISKISFKGDSKIFIKYCIYAFGLPFVMTLNAILLDEYDVLPFEMSPAIGSIRCYFQANIQTEAIYVYIPISIIILVNIMFFLDTAMKIWKVHSATSDENSERRMQNLRKRFYIYLRLFIVMGIMWCMETISWLYYENNLIFHIADFLNCIQGLWIFLVCVCDIKTRHLIAKKCCPSSISIEESEAYAVDFNVTNEEMKMSDTK